MLLLGQQSGQWHEDPALPHLLPGARTGETLFPFSCCLTVSPDLADYYSLLTLGNRCAVSSVRNIRFKGSSMMLLVVKFAQKVSGSW